MTGPTRLPLVGEDTTDETLNRVYERVRQAVHHVPNLYRTLGNAPNLLEAWIDFAWQLRHDAVTDRGTRELLIMRTAQLNGTDYEWRHHWSMAIESGVSEEQLGALDGWRDSPLFSDEQQAVLAMAEELAQTTKVSDTTWAALQKTFDDRQLVELVLTGAFYACVSRVLGGLQVPIEEGYDQIPSL